MFSSRPLVKLNNTLVTTIIFNYCSTELAIITNLLQGFVLASKLINLGIGRLASFFRLFAAGTLLDHSDSLSDQNGNGWPRLGPKQIFHADLCLSCISGTLNEKSGTNVCQKKKSYLFFPFYSLCSIVGKKNNDNLNSHYTGFDKFSYN